jgi:hypothetical protein
MHAAKLWILLEQLRHERRDVQKPEGHRHVDAQSALRPAAGPGQRSFYARDVIEDAAALLVDARPRERGDARAEARACELGGRSAFMAGLARQPSPVDPILWCARDWYRGSPLKVDCSFNLSIELSIENPACQESPRHAACSVRERRPGIEQETKRVECGRSRVAAGCRSSSACATG